MPTKWQGEPKTWRVRGESSDGMIVTLGRHDTEEAAKADAAKLVKEGFYGDVTIEPIEVVEKPAAENGQRPAGG